MTQTFAQQEKRLDLELFALAVQVAKVPQATKKIVASMLHRLFEAISSGNEGLETVQRSEVQALKLTLGSASHELNKEILQLRAQQKDVHERAVAFERRCKTIEQARLEELQHFHKHEAALVVQDTEKAAASLREKLKS